MYIGNIPWTNKEIIDELDTFSDLYNKRPIKVNNGGMLSPHCFATYFLMKKINKPYICESGIWQGQSTWLIEQTCPKAQIISLDPNMNNRLYISNNVQYCRLDWSKLNFKEPDQTLCFFDDHQNAFERIKRAVKDGYKYLIFEDNYPVGQGDCQSLKQIFDSNDIRSNYLKEHIKIYYEFPPVFVNDKTRWGDDWMQERYPTTKPLFDELNETNNKYKMFYDEAQSYTWIAYVELK